MSKVYFVYFEREYQVTYLKYLNDFRPEWIKREKKLFNKKNSIIFISNSTKILAVHNDDTFLVIQTLHLFRHLSKHAK